MTVWGKTGRWPSVRRGMVRRPGGPIATPVTLALSGNEITDAVRTTNTAGDGRTPPDSSVGIWQETTNLEASAGADVSFAAGTTGYTTGGTNTIASSIEQAKFETHSCKATYQNNATLLDIALTLTAAGHSASRWLYIPTNYDGQGVRVQFVNFVGAAGTLTADANMGLRDQWQRVGVPNVTPAGGDLTGNVQVINTGTAPTAGRFIYIDGCQTEAKVLATPFTPTNRGGPLVQAVPSMLQMARGWVAIRLRPGWAGAAQAGFPSPFSLRDASLFGVEMFHNAGSWYTQISDGGGANAAQLVAGHAAGDVMTIISTWTATTLGISKNGGAFTTAAHSRAPGAATAFTIGSSLFSTNVLDGDILWVACGTGTLTDADAAAIHANGDPDPSPTLFPFSARLSGIWPAVTNMATAYS